MEGTPSPGNGQINTRSEFSPDQHSYKLHPYWAILHLTVCIQFNVNMGGNVPDTVCREVESKGLKAGMQLIFIVLSTITKIFT